MLLYYGVGYAAINNISLQVSGNAVGIGIVDLTAVFGSGNEPNLDWCDQNINYFDGQMIVYK